MDTASKRPRLEALTGLRYIAALCVLVYHFSANFPEGQFKRAVGELGGIPMQLFFTLSGFLLAYNYAGGFGTSFRKTIGRYYLTRFARIYPVYFLALVLWLGLAGRFFADLQQHPRDTWVSLGMTATMTQNWFYVPLYEGTNDPRLASFAHMWIGWTVSVECFFYLMFPFVVVPVVRYVTTARRAWLVGGGIYVAYLAVNYVIAKRADPATPALLFSWQLLWNPYIRLGEFLIGVVAGQAFLCAMNRPLNNRGWWLGTGAIVAGTVGLFYLNHWITTANKSAVLNAAASNVLYAPLSVLIVYGLARIPSRVQRLMATSPMVTLGEMTYCLYLLHPLVQVVYAARLQGLEDRSNTATLIFNHFVVFLFLHFVCLGMYRYGELPLRAFVRRVFEGPKEKRSTAREQPALRIAA